MPKKEKFFIEILILVFGSSKKNYTDNSTGQIQIIQPTPRFSYILIYSKLAKHTRVSLKRVKEIFMHITYISPPETIFFPSFSLEKKKTVSPINMLFVDKSKYILHGQQKRRKKFTTLTAYSIFFVFFFFLFPLYI